jgi:hypothetical protein
MSLVPVIVVGAAGGVAAVAAACSISRVTADRTWSNGRTVLWFRASIGLYPALKTLVSVSLALASNDLQVAAISTAGNRRTTPVFLRIEHRHLANHEASYFAAHLMILPPLVAVQLMLKAGTTAVTSLVGFSAVHFWIASDDRADVGDETVFVVFVAHVVVLMLALVPLLCDRVVRAWRWKRRQRSTEEMVHAAAKHL